MTLRGAGGSGKTRLAKEVAHRVEADFEGGAWWIEFGEVDDTVAGGSTTTVVETIARALGMIRRSQVSLSDALVDHIGATPTLLVLDNCEHLIDEVADALLAAHTAGILHRDVKPENILLDAELEPRLVDFGLANFADEQGLLTGTGLALGTPLYMAPEVLSKGSSAATPSNSKTSPAATVAM